MTTPYVRPVLSLRAARLFHDIVAYVKRYYVETHPAAHPSTLPSASYDHMAGYWGPRDPEVRELVAKGIVDEVHDSAPGEGKWTSWHLTDYGCWAVTGGKYPTGG